MPVNDTPIIKKKNFKVDRNLTIGQIKVLIGKLINLPAGESLHIYVNQIFAPSIEQSVGTLFDCFNTESKLVLYYSKSLAWG